MASKPDDKISITAQCLCKANTFTTTYPKSSLPLPAHICHCTSCRHLSGNLFTACTQWTGTEADIDTTHLKRYNFTARYDIIFCPTCSTPMFWSPSKDPSQFLDVCTGVLSNLDVDLIHFTEHIFVGDTQDGGASAWLIHINANGDQAKLYETSTKGKELPKDWQPPLSQLTGYGARKEDAVPIRCRCKGVDFVLHRSDYAGVKDEDLPPQIDPKTHKYLADFCACDSCRLQGGVDIFSWTYSDMKNISFAHSSKTFPRDKYELQKLVDDKDEAVGTLTYYNSSSAVHRFFCSTCSSCVFYTTDSRPSITDIAVGTLDASDGARAEGMLSWSLGWPMDSLDDGKGGWRAGVFDRMGRSAENYREERGYPKNWIRMKKEKEVAEGNQG